MLKENGTINVCVACDNNYAKYAGVVIASILNNADPHDKLAIFILDGGISEEHKREITSLKSIRNFELNFIYINPILFSEYANIKTHKYITIATYYRLKLASLIPNIDKIIYFDCDMVINSSLSELFNTNMDGYLVAGVQDINKKMVKKNPTYVNAGMLIFNLAEIRKDGIEDKFLKWTKEHFAEIKTGDQTIINEVCKEKIKLVNPIWNVQSSNFTNRSNYTNSPKVIHFVAKNKPWKKNCFSIHKNLYFKYLQLTPWKLTDEELSKALKSNAIEYIKYRPLFWLRPRFYEALLKTYIFKGEKMR